MFKSYANMRQPADGDGNIDHRTYTAMLRAVGRSEGVSMVGTICPSVEIEITDLSKFGSGGMASQPSGSDSPDAAAVLCWLDYWADQPRRRKNVHNFKEDQLVLYSTSVAVPYSK